MLAAFLEARREELLARCRSKLEGEHPGRSPVEAESNMARFCEDLVAALRAAPAEAPPPPPRRSEAAPEHGAQRERLGVGVQQIARDYGVICDQVAALAAECGQEVSPREWQVLNQVIDVAISDALVSYWQRSTERERQEIALHLGQVAHELRNSLASAQMAFRIVESGRVGVASRTGEVVRRSLARATQLVGQLASESELAGGRPPSRTRVALARLVETVEAAAVIDKPLALRSSVEPPDLTVLGDEALLASALTNLVQNAIKFSRSDGQVVVRARGGPAGVTIAVEDSCGGLPAGVEEEIFRPFVQRGLDRTGLGLGLAIVRRVMDAHGGRVTVENRAGRGCVFRLHLPG